jgi:hypothetical protein
MNSLSTAAHKYKSSAPVAAFKINYDAEKIDGGIPLSSQNGMKTGRKRAPGREPTRQFFIFST